MQPVGGCSPLCTLFADVCAAVSSPLLVLPFLLLPPRISLRNPRVPHAHLFSSMSRGLRLCCISAALHSSTASSQSRDNSNKDKDDIDVVTLGALQPPLVGESRHLSSSSGSNGAGWGRAGKTSLGKAESLDETLARLLQHTVGSVLEAQHQQQALEAGDLSNALAVEEEVIGATPTEERSEPDASSLLEGLGEYGRGDMDGVERTIPAVGQVDQPRVDDVLGVDVPIQDKEDEDEHEVDSETAASSGSGDGTGVDEVGDGGGEAAAVNENEAGASTINGVGAKPDLERGFESSSGIDPSALSLNDESVSADLLIVVSPELLVEVGGAMETATEEEDTDDPGDLPEEDQAASSGADVLADGQGYPRGNDALSPMSEEGMDYAGDTEEGVMGAGVALPSSVVLSPDNGDSVDVGEERGARDESYARGRVDRGNVKVAEALADDLVGSAGLEGRGTGGWVDQLEVPVGGVPLGVPLGVPQGGDETPGGTTTRTQEELPAEKVARGASIEEPLTQDVDGVVITGGAFGAAWRNAAADEVDPREQQKGVEPGAVSTATTTVVDDGGLGSDSMRYPMDARRPVEKPRLDIGGDVKEATNNDAALLTAADSSTLRERLTRGDGRDEGGRGGGDEQGSEQRAADKRPVFVFSEPAKNGGGTVGGVGSAPGGLASGLSPDNGTGFTMPPLPPIDLNDPASMQGFDLGGDSQGDSSEWEGWWDTWGNRWANVAKEAGLRWARIASDRGAALADAGLQMCRARAVKTWHDILEPRVQRLRQRLEDAARAAYDEVGEYIADPMLAEGL